MSFRLTKKKVWIGLSLLIISLAIPATLLLLKRNTDTRTGAETELADVFFLPETATLPPGQQVRLMIDSKQIPLGFVQLDISFDNTKVKVKDELAITDTLKNVIRKSTNAEMNSNGMISIALGLSPDDKDNAPQGVIELATFTIEENSTENAAAMFQFTKTQLVKATEPVEVLVNSKPLTVTISKQTPAGTGGTTNTSGLSRYKYGDINEDGVVNILDYSILFDNFGKQLAAGHQFKKADINDDGTVNILDYSILFDNFGKQIE